MRLADLARRLGAEVVGDADRKVTGVRALDEAGPEHLSFLHNPKYLRQAQASRAGAILVQDPAPFAGRDLLVCQQPYLAMARALEILHPAEPPPIGVHPTAVVADDAELGDQVSIGPYSVIGSGCRIGNGTVVGPLSVLGRSVTVGDECLLHPRVVVEDRCRIGDRCILHAGVVIGSDGYGFATIDGVHHKVPQVGIVVIEDDVELGANVCVDRATLGETRIGRGTKLDNLVHVAHNVQIGEGSLLVAGVGISGSTRIGHHATFAGHSGAAGHLEIGDNVVVGSKSAVMKDLPDGAVVSGTPARPLQEWLKANANLRRLDSLRKRVRELEDAVASLERAQRGCDT